MKQLPIVTKSQANKILVNSLFVPVKGRTLQDVKYCSGKYKPDAFPVGREMEVNENVHALYVKKGRDSEGQFSQLHCIAEV